MCVVLKLRQNAVMGVRGWVFEQPPRLRLGLYQNVVMCACGWSLERSRLRLGLPTCVRFPSVLWLMCSQILWRYGLLWHRT